MKKIVKKLAGALVLAGFLCMMFLSAQVFADEVSLETFITSMKTGEFELNEEAQQELIEAVNDGNHDKQMEIYEDYFDGGSSKKQPDVEDIVAAAAKEVAKEVAKEAGKEAGNEIADDALTEVTAKTPDTVTVENEKPAENLQTVEAPENTAVVNSPDSQVAAGEIVSPLPDTVTPDVQNPTVTDALQNVNETAVIEVPKADTADVNVITAAAEDNITPVVTEVPVVTQIPTSVPEAVPVIQIQPTTTAEPTQVQPAHVAPVPTTVPVLEIKKIEEALNITATDRGNAYKGLGDADFNALCKIVEAECTGEGEYGKLLVANVVLNRVSSPKFPSTVTGVITQSGQFQPVANGRYYSAVPTAETIAAVNRALSGENNSRGTLYFKSVRSHQKWGNKVFAFAYKNHLFFY